MRVAAYRYDYDQSAAARLMFARLVEFGHLSPHWAHAPGGGWYVMLASGDWPALRRLQRDHPKLFGCEPPEGGCCGK